MNRRVTMIDELPELADLEGMGAGSHFTSRGQQPRPMHEQMYEQGSQLAPEQDPKYQKLIRANRQQLSESGMVTENFQASRGYGELNGPYRTLQPQPQAQPPQEMMEQMVYQKDDFDPLMNISCLQIAKHVEKCPICSRFYNNDRSAYVIAIVLLSVVCLLLLKRVLDV